MWVPTGKPANPVVTDLEHGRSPSGNNGVTMSTDRNHENTGGGLRGRVASRSGEPVAI